MSQPIEALLRPPVEIGAATTNLAIAVASVGAPQLLLVPGGVGYGIAACCSLRALILLRRAVRLMRYQRRLRTMPAYTIRPERVAGAKHKLFLGKGFEWKAVHTQRYADIQRSEYRDFDRPGPVWKVVRRLVDTISMTPLRPLMAPFNSHSLLNPFAPRGYVEGSPELHGVGLYERESAVYLQQVERTAHTFVVGTTRVGKTRLLELLATQDIHNGEAVVIFDPKGDGSLLARIYTEANKAGRADDLQIFHLGFPDESVGYNPIGSYSRVTEVATRVASQLPGEGNASAFREFAWRYVNLLAQTLDALDRPINFSSLLYAATNLDALVGDYLDHLAQRHELPDWSECVQAVINGAQKLPLNYRGRQRAAWARVEVFNQSAVNDGLAGSLINTLEHDKSHFDKLIASLYPLLEKLTSGPAARLLSPESWEADAAPGGRLSWRAVLERGGIVYVGLDALSDPDVAGAVGNAMFADLTSVAGSVYKDLQSGGRPRKLCVHADEFNELVGKEFIPLANKAGGAGFQLTVYTQTLSDIVARFSDQARAGQVVGNLGSLIMFRVKEPATAELLTARLKDVEINHMMLESGSTDSSDPDNDVHFVSNTRQRITSQRVPMIHPGDLDALPKGHAFALMAGRLYKLRLPLFADDGELPTGLKAMVDAMARQYVQGGVDWAHATALGWK